MDTIEAEPKKLPANSQRRGDGVSVASVVSGDSLPPVGQSELPGVIETAAENLTPTINIELERELATLQGMQKLLSENLTSDQTRALMLLECQHQEFQLFKELLTDIKATPAGEKRAKLIMKLIELMNLSPKTIEQNSMKRDATKAFAKRPVINVTVNKGAALNIAPSNSPYKPEDYKGLEPSNSAGGTSSVFEADQKKKAVEAKTLTLKETGENWEDLNGE